MQPKWVQTALTHKTSLFKSLFKFTGFDGSKRCPLGVAYSSATSSFVNLLMKTGVPFHTICITSDGGSKDTSTSR